MVNIYKIVISSITTKMQNDFCKPQSSPASHKVCYQASSVYVYLTELLSFGVTILNHTNVVLMSHLYGVRSASNFSSDAYI